ncbi:MAG: HlyD family efflux transporter periplasmic adaptor subunit [Sphingomonadales bacterium]|nr:HlyD family efflux transporter periplasmic adaptor subunit [Sphingomonadales bacterium]MDE2170494.1 HlyD family efflux transporter periplasmic adaptor subunit [Sphingomonadales bacterium]
MTKRRVISLAISSSVLLSGSYLMWQWYGQRGQVPAWIVRGNGRVEMVRTDVAVKYPGRLVSVLVREGDDVHEGMLIAQEDDADTLAQLAGARAARARAVAAIATAEGERGIREGQARSAQIDWHESVGLRAKSMVSGVELEQRRIALDTASSGVKAASGGVAEARAAITQADAQIAQLQTVVNDMRIVSPTSGRVEYRIVEPGTVLPAGGKIISLVDTQDVHLTIFLPARIAGRLRIGDDAFIMPEGFSRPVPAHVSFVSPEAQFTPKFVETSSEREKLSYRVKLQVPADVARRLAGQLKAGMTADGYIRLDRGKAWPNLSRSGE